MGDLAAVQDELTAQGVGLAAISVDDAAESRKLADSLGVRFGLLADPGARVITSYGVLMDGEPYAVPSTFVIRPDRTIAWQYVGETVPDRPAIDVVREELARTR